MPDRGQAGVRALRLLLRRDRSVLRALTEEAVGQAVDRVEFARGSLDPAPRCKNLVETVELVIGEAAHGAGQDHERREATVEARTNTEFLGKLSGEFLGECYL